jgi:hypothetical protein
MNPFSGKDDSDDYDKNLNPFATWLVSLF